MSCAISIILFLVCMYFYFFCVCLAACFLVSHMEYMYLLTWAVIGAWWEPYCPVQFNEFIYSKTALYLVCWAK